MGPVCFDNVDAGMLSALVLIIEGLGHCPGSLLMVMQWKYEDVQVYLETVRQAFLSKSNHAYYEV